MFQGFASLPTELKLKIVRKVSFLFIFHKNTEARLNCDIFLFLTGLMQFSRGIISFLKKSAFSYPLKPNVKSLGLKTVLIKK